MEKPAHLEATSETVSQSETLEAGSLPHQLHPEMDRGMTSPPTRHPYLTLRVELREGKMLHGKLQTYVKPQQPRLDSCTGSWEACPTCGEEGHAMHSI